MSPRNPNHKARLLADSVADTVEGGLKALVWILIAVAALAACYVALQAIYHFAVVALKAING